LRMRAIPECLRGVFTMRHYTKSTFTFTVTIRYDTIVAWCTLKYKIKNRPVVYYRVSRSYVVLGNARVKK